MDSQQNGRRLQALFEHCCTQIGNNSRRRGLKFDFAKDVDGTYSNPSTEDLYHLWLSGHGQGVADHAVARGDIEL